MLLRAASYSDMNVLRPFSLGDVMDTQEQFTALTTVGAGTITAAMIAGGALKRTGPVGGFTDTFDTVQNIITALSGVGGGVSTAQVPAFNPSFQSVTFGILYQTPGQPQPGASFRWLYLNTVAFAMTAAATANSGLTLGTNVNVAASLVRQYLFQITNGTPQSLVNGQLTNASGVVTGLSLAQTNVISVGQAAFGTSVGASALVASIQPGVGITLSVNSSASVLSAITLTPTITLTGLFSATA
jgi:hypothetical protein